MGLIRGTVTLANPPRPELAPIEVSAQADSRAVPWVGPLEVRFGNRRCFTGGMVLGNAVLLGVIPMQDMDLVLRPQLQSIEVNPESPNIPLSVAK